MHMRMWVVAVCLWCAASTARAQFDTPASSDVRQRVAGDLISQGGPTPEAGDQLGAFSGNLLVGKHTFTSGTEFAFVLFGDEDGTTEVEGAKNGDRIEFRFYDASANVTYRGLGIKNEAGETFNYRYSGTVLPPFDLPGFPIDLLIPTQPLDLVVTSNPDDSGFGTGGGGGGGGDDEPAGDFDVDGDGKVTTRDAALVLRIVAGSSSASEEEIQRADVNGDQVVSTDDAIAVLRNR
jgi:hypothetical protein